MERLYNLRIYMTGKRCVNFFQCIPRSAATDLDNVVKWHDDVGLAENKRRVLLYIVVVDNEPNNDLYQTIKQKLDFNAMINQVITVGVLRNAKMSYRRDLRETSEDFTYNIALNINAKLGGVNCIPSDDPLNLWNEDVNRDELFMFIGIDTRLSSQKSKLGLVGITASIDNKGTRYNAYAIITNGVQKYCSDYKSILFKAFNAYEGATGQRSQFPTKILVFRAGMNEYDLTKGEGLLEISHIENVIRQYMDEYELRRKPLITYIGYHRSHGVKFYDLTMKTRIPPLKSDTDLEGVKLNVPPGTVIDSEITNPNCFYFGTTKPAKYTIVVDNINFKADNLLAIVYQLCRLMPQTKRSFRKPVPIGLASKLLERCLTVQPNLFESMDKEELFYINPDFVSRPFYI
uniref:Piwi domain-containing protein n=1 Tax=Panagrolaimus davidi TaxID=227884 RepID=A0A914RB61_9BILA